MPGAVSPFAPSMHATDYSTLLLNYHWVLQNFQRMITYRRRRRQGCGVGIARSRNFSGGVGAEFRKTLGVGVGIFCPTPEVQLIHSYITLPIWEFLLK